MPAPAIRHIHNTPHLDWNFQSHSNDFDITSESVWNSYSKSIITLPVVIGVIGIACVVIFQLFWCCKACCCRKGSRLEGTTRSEIYVWMKSKIESRKRVTLAFYILIALSVISMATYYSAIIDVNDGFETYYDALNSLDNTFSTLSDEGYNLEKQGVYLSYNLGNSSCGAAAALQDTIPVYQNYVAEYSSYVDPVTDPVSNAHDQGHYFNRWKMAVLWSVAGVIYVSVAFFFFAHCCRSKVVMHLAIGCGEIVLVFLIISNMVWFSVLILGADFCMDPTANAIMVAPEDTQEMITYYATCEGVNPLIEPLESAYNYTILFNETIYELSNSDSIYCPDDPYLLACYDNIDSIVKSLESITDEAQCEPIKDEWDSVLDDATCDSIFTGILDLWAGEYWTAATLFALVITATIVYDHFDTWFESEDTSPFNTGTVSSSVVDSRTREKSINLGAKRPDNVTDGQNNHQTSVPFSAKEEVAYSTTFLYDESPRSPKDDDSSPMKFVF